MNRLFLLVILLLSVEGLGAQQIDVKHVQLNLMFSWEKRQAIGTAAITFSTMQESATIALDAGFLSIQKILLNNQDLAYQYNGGDSAKNLLISLNRQYKPEETATITIHYHTNYENKADPNAIAGSFGKGLRFFQPTSTTPNKHRQIWSSGQPDGNKYWFPCNEDIADIHTTEVMATVPKPFTAISNGALVGTKVNLDGTQTFHYQSLQPFPNYLVSIAIGIYDPVIQKSGNTTIYTYGYPQEKQAVKATVELLPKMIAFLEEKTGCSYPFGHYKQVVVQDYPFPGLVGQQTAVLLSDNYIDDYGVHKDFKYLWDGVAVQALAAQWFGNLLMPETWNDIWLNNAFAEYFAGLFTSKDNAAAEYLLWYYYPWEKAIVAADWQSGIQEPVVPADYKAVSSYHSNNSNKFRGALVLRMLQQEMGEDKWWQAIKYYVRTHAGKQVTTQDFRHAVEKIAGQSYQWFFDQWLYRTGMPNLEVVNQYHAKKKELHLLVKQKQDSSGKITDKQVKYFAGKIGVEIDGRTEYVWLQPQAETKIIWPQSKQPGYVHFNVNENFLCDYVFLKTSTEYLYQLKHADDIAARKIALDQLATIALDSTTSLAEKNAIATQITAEVQSKKYWRYRMYALGTLQRIQPKPYPEAFTALLVELAGKEKSWLKSTAIAMLGNTNSEQYLKLYQAALKDSSDRVINSAAIALGKTKSPKAYDVLMSLEHQPSWKNQNRISALNGLQQLGDERAAAYALQCIKDNQSPRWYLATPVWDYPFAAVNTLVALGKAELAYPVLLERFKTSLTENDINDIFQNLQLIDLLKDKRMIEVYGLLKEHFKNDALLLETVTNYEKQYLESIKQ